MKKDKAILIAKYFIWKSKQDPKTTGFDALKLQKLLYYAQAWNLVFQDKRLFDDEIEAWIRGPVVPKVYDEFKDTDFDTVSIDESDFSVLGSKEIDILDEVWRVYGKYDGAYLEALTHDETPWQEARKGLEISEPSQNIIPIDKMKEYYGKRLTQATPGTPEASN